MLSAHFHAALQPLVAGAALDARPFQSEVFVGVS